MIDIKIDSKICYIYINRPKHLNAINIDLLNQLKDFLDKYRNSKNENCVYLFGSPEISNNFRSILRKIEKSGHFF